MKLLLLSFFVAAAFAAPAPLDDEVGEPVELIVNGVAEGEPLEIGDVLGIKVKQHVEGVVVSATDLLYPLTAAGLEEAGAADRPVEVEDIPEIIEGPEAVELPAPVLPELVPMPPINIPVEIPENVEIDEPSELLPEHIQIPDTGLPSLPEILPPVDTLPEIQPPVEEVPEVGPQFPSGEVFNNGLVQVTLNTPEPGVLSTVQSWFNMVVNYFNGSDVTSHQIV